MHIADDPGVLAAINPYYAITFVAGNGWIGLITLGAVFLVVTGSEALYADLGHFGRKPIQMAWFYLVLPALLINYFGQGALVLANPAAIENPFYRLVPDMLLLPMVVLATVATVIASQAVITGAYSITHQAIQLGLLPRLEIRHTSAALYGQIYMPRVNTLLLVGVLLLVGLFRTSSDLAGAYVLAVAGDQPDGDAAGLRRGLEDVAAGSSGRRLLLISPFIVADITYPVRRTDEARRRRLAAGGVRRAGRAGDDHLAARHRASWCKRRGASKCRSTSLVHSLEKKPPHVVPGTAVFLTSDPEFAPTALLHNLKHNKVLHEHNVILTIIFADTPRVPESERVTITPVSDHFQPRGAEIRLHGAAQRAEGAGDRPQARLDLRHHVDVVLPVAARDQGGGPFRHAALAGPHVHRARQVGLRCLRLLPDPDRPGDGGRHPGDGVDQPCPAPCHISI